jgi:excinuclease ABC subunit A
MKSLNALVEHGHSVILIEHNVEVIKCADWVIDLGPEGGDKGGYVVFEGTPEQLAKHDKSYTAKYLRLKVKG